MYLCVWPVPLFCGQAVAGVAAREMEAGPPRCVCPLVGAHDCACPCAHCWSCKVMLLVGHDCPLKKCPCGHWVVSCQAMEEVARSRQEVADLQAYVEGLQARMDVMDTASPAEFAAWVEEQAAEEAEWAALEEEDAVNEDEGIVECVAPR